MSSISAQHAKHIAKLLLYIFEFATIVLGL